MYLSRVFLNPLRRATRELAASPQRMHAAVLGGSLPVRVPTEAGCCGASIGRPIAWSSTW